MYSYFLLPFNSLLIICFLVLSLINKTAITTKKTKVIVTKWKKKSCYIKVCAYKLDRFGRNATDLLNFIELLKENGVKLFCVDDKIEYDPTDETQYMTKFLIMFLSLMAELERNNIRQRVIVTKDSLSRHGFWLGGTAPYGFEAVRVPNDGIILEEGTPSDVFDNPQHDRTKEFLSKVL